MLCVRTLRWSLNVFKKQRIPSKLWIQRNFVDPIKKKSSPNRQLTDELNPGLKLYQFQSKSCTGCGAPFQSSAMAEPGFVPMMAPKYIPTPEYIEKLKRQKEPLNPKELKILIDDKKGRTPRIICQRCHFIRNGVSVTAPLKTNRMQFADLKTKTGGMVIAVIDLTNIPGTIITDLQDLVGQKDFIILLNKLDLMPDDFDSEAACKWIKKLPFAANALDVIPYSSESNFGLKPLKKYLSESFKKKENCYLVGYTSVGKSSIMNQMKTILGDNEFLTVSPKSGTTIGLIKIPGENLDLCLTELENHDFNFKDYIAPIEEFSHHSKYSLIDTSGLVCNNHIANIFTHREMKYVRFKSKIIPLDLTRKAKTAFWIGGFCRIEITECKEPMNFRLYLPSPLKTKIHTCSISKIKDLEKQIGYKIHLLSPPIRSSRLKTNPFPRLQFVEKIIHSNESPRTIYILGVGWITVTGPEGAIYRIFTPNGMKVDTIPQSFKKRKSVKDI